MAEELGPTTRQLAEIEREKFALQEREKAVLKGEITLVEEINRNVGGCLPLAMGVLAGAIVGAGAAIGVETLAAPSAKNIFEQPGLEGALRLAAVGTIQVLGMLLGGWMAFQIELDSAISKTATKYNRDRISIVKAWNSYGATNSFQQGRQ